MDKTFFIVIIPLVIGACIFAAGAIVIVHFVVKFW